MYVDHFRVPGISCDHCVRAITNEVSAIAGVQQVLVSVADKQVQVSHDAPISVDTLIHAIQEAGFDEVAVLA